MAVWGRSASGSQGSSPRDPSPAAEGLMPEIVGQVAELWRYPVKSMGGERMDAVRCTLRGFEGDRRWAVQASDGKLGSGKSSRRFHALRGLLSVAAFIDAAGDTRIRLPDGAILRVDDPAAALAVGRITGETVRLVSEGAVSHFDQAPLHLLSAASVRGLAALHPEDAVDRRRFRPNLLVETEGPARAEDGWVGRELQVGGVRLSVEDRTSRCVMVTLAQDGLPPAPRLLRALEEESEMRMGVYGRVLQEGTIRVGDSLTLRSEPAARWPRATSPNSSAGTTGPRA